MDRNSATKDQSFALMKRFETMYGDNTANYYKALLNALYNKQVRPSVIVGGGLRNPVGVAERWLKDKISKAEQAGNIGKGTVTVSKPAKPTYSETDGYFYFVHNKTSRDLLYFGWTPTTRGADRAKGKAFKVATALVSYGNHYSEDQSGLQEALSTHRMFVKLPAEKKSIANKGYDEYKISSGWSSAETIGNSIDTQDLVNYSTDHLTRKEKKIFEKFVKLMKTKKRGSSVSLRKDLIRLAHSNPELRKDLLPLIQKSASYSYEHSGHPFDPYCVKPIVVPRDAGIWLTTTVLIVMEMSQQKGFKYSFTLGRKENYGKENPIQYFRFGPNEFSVGVDPSRYIIYFSAPKKRYAVTKDWNRTTPEMLATEIIKFFMGNKKEYDQP